MGELDERRFHPLHMNRLAHGLKDRKVDDLAQSLSDEWWIWLAAGRTNECSPPDLAGNEAAPDQFLIGTAHRLYGHVQASGKLTMSWKARAGLQAAIGYRARDLIGQGQIDRSA
jgi:hypothetical protein